MTEHGGESLGDNGGGSMIEALRDRSAFHPHAVYRRGNVVVRETGPWAGAVHALLRHLELVGFAGAPRIVGSGFDAAGRETLSFIEGEFTQPGPWSLDGATAVGRLLRELRDATASFRPPADARWWPWFGRSLGGARRVIGHCDAAPWNIVAREGLPVALIDWERAGPVDPLVELAQACWLNAKLHDDSVAAREGLPSLAERVRQLRAIVDGYGLSRAERRGFSERIIAFAAFATANEADDAGVTREAPPAQYDPQLVWALTWRARSVAYMLQHRRTLQNALA